MSFRFRDELKMNVNQHTPMASPYGQPQPGYGQPAFAPLDSGYPPGPYAPYNGPVSAYQTGEPPQGKNSTHTWLDLIFVEVCRGGHTEN